MTCIEIGGTVVMAILGLWAGVRTAKHYHPEAPVERVERVVNKAHGLEANARRQRIAGASALRQRQAKK